MKNLESRLKKMKVGDEISIDKTPYSFKKTGDDLFFRLYIADGYYTIKSILGTIKTNNVKVG
jgi:hypothetical protein